MCEGDVNQLTEAGPLYQIRVYGSVEGDAEMVAGWWRGHGQEKLPVFMLPPDGFIVERDGEAVGAVWLYLVIGVGVAFPEFASSKPGMQVKEARQAFEVLMEFIKAHARSHGYGLLWCHTKAGIARVLSEQGFRKFTSATVSLISSTETEIDLGD